MKMKNTHKDTSNVLEQKRKHLVSNFLMEGNASYKPAWDREPDFLEQNARLLDDYFRERFEKSEVGLRMGINKNPYAIIALGGYGREEQCIHSDVDILFLFEKKVPKEAEALIQEIIYPLWDIRMDVGHATRSLQECIDIAEEDIEAMTSMLDARFISGMSFLYSALMERLRKKILVRRSDEFIHLLIERNRERHQHFGDCAYLLEPNLKEGQGGLRDYHTVLWIARIKANIKHPRDLEYYGCLSHDEFEMVTDALSFIWYVRNRLHDLVGKKYDQLHFDHQEKLARAMNFNEQNGQQPVEIFLGKLHEKMEFIKQLHVMFLYELEVTAHQKQVRKFEKVTEGLEIKKGTLKFVSHKDIPDSPNLLINIFRESARLKIPLGSEAKRVVKDFLHLVDTDFRNSASAVRSFEQILLEPAPKFNVLNEMLNTGFLVQFIPEFNEILNRIQYDEYHLYPVDKHLLHTVRTIKKFGESDDPSQTRLCGNLYHELSEKNRLLLLWGALLHDIGKGEWGGGHSLKGAKIVINILAEKGYSIDDIETVSFLVLEHLMLIKAATRRDIHDEETAIFCARKAKDTDQVKMLYLLTVADSISTGPKAWSEWTSALLTGLFLNIINVMEKGELATTETVEIVENKKKEIQGMASKQWEEMKPLFNMMSPRYFLHASSSDMLDHVRLYRDMGPDGFAWEIISPPESDTRKVTICAKDRPGLFSKIAGVFTLNNINILNAYIHTWQNNTALDIFEVTPPPDRIFEDEKWERTRENLQAALSGTYDIAEELEKKMPDYRSVRPLASERPDRIVIDNENSSFFTIIEVFTHDFPGLLFGITDALFRCGLDVRVAKIATNVDQVVDVFYVREIDGQKADSPDRVSAIKAAIKTVLPDTESQLEERTVP